MKQKPAPIPIVTSGNLRDVIFKKPGWPLPYNRNLGSFHINRLEDARQGIQFPIPPHRKTVIDFIVVTSGSIVRRIGLTRYDVPARSFIVLPAHQICSDEWMSDDVQGYYCHFTPELLTQQSRQAPEQEFSFLRFQGQPPITLPDDSFDELLLLVRRLERVYRSDRAGAIDLLRLYLLTLFTELQQAAAPTQPAAQPGQVALRTTEQYKQALAQFIYDKQQVADYAQLLNMSPNHLNKCVKLATGQSARALLDEMVLLEAKVLLTHTNLSISEIAFRIGKQEPGNFTRFFRKKSGVSPRQFRLRR